MSSTTTVAIRRNMSTESVARVESEIPAAPSHSTILTRIRTKLDLEWPSSPMYDYLIAFYYQVIYSSIPLCYSQSSHPVAWRVASVPSRCSWRRWRIQFRNAFSIGVRLSRRAHCKSLYILCIHWIVHFSNYSFYLQFGGGSRGGGGPTDRSWRRLGLNLCEDFISCRRVAAPLNALRLIFLINSA